MLSNNRVPGRVWHSTHASLSYQSYSHSLLSNNQCASPHSQQCTVLPTPQVHAPPTRAARPTAGTSRRHRSCPPARIGPEQATSTGCQQAPPAFSTSTTRHQSTSTTRCQLTTSSSSTPPHVHQPLVQPSARWMRFNQLATCSPTPPPLLSAPPLCTPPSRPAGATTTPYGASSSATPTTSSSGITAYTAGT